MWTALLPVFVIVVASFSDGSAQKKGTAGAER